MRNSKTRARTMVAPIATLPTACQPADGPLPLHACSNFAVSGTGSRALFSYLAQYSPFAHHIENQMTVPPSAACVFITIADPARRLEAAFRFHRKYRQSLLRRKEPLALALSAANSSLDSSHLAKLVQALRVPTSRTAQLYRSSVNGLPKKKAGGGNRGVLFFISQQLYLRRLNATCRGRNGSLRVRLICTERLDEEWTTILTQARWPFPWVPWWRDPWDCSWRLLLDAPSRLLGRTPSLAACNTISWRLPQATGTQETGFGERNARGSSHDRPSELSAADAKYVREVLYRDDWALHQQLCSSSRPRSEQRNEAGMAAGTLLAIGIPALFLGSIALVFAVPCVYLLRCASLVQAACLESLC